MSKNADPHKYKYSGYVIRCEAGGSVSLSDGGEQLDKNVVIFEADTSHQLISIIRKRISWLLLKVQPLVRWYYVDCKERKLYKFYWATKETSLSVQYNGITSYEFVNDIEIYKFKAKDCETNVAPLCLGVVLKDFSVDYVKKIEICGYVHDFSVDHDSTDVDDILDIYKYLKKKDDMKYCKD